jgi:hypothetical protein
MTWKIDVLYNAPADRARKAWISEVVHHYNGGLT